MMVFNMSHSPGEVSGLMPTTRIAISYAAGSTFRCIVYPVSECLCGLCLTGISGLYAENGIVFAGQATPKSDYDATILEV
jgi:hypothetical protein